MNDGEFINYYSTINFGIIVKAFRLIFILMPLSKMQGVGMAKILRNSDFNYKNYRNSALGVPLYNKWIFRYGFLKEMWPNPQFSTYLVHLTEEIFTENFKVHFFMYRVSKIINLINFKWSDSVTKLHPSLQFSYFTRLICKKKIYFINLSYKVCPIA